MLPITSVIPAKAGIELRYRAVFTNEPDICL